MSTRIPEREGQGRRPTMNDNQTHKSTDEQLADIERRITHARIRRAVRAELMASAPVTTPTTAQYIPPIGTPLPMLERGGKKRVTFTPDERRAKANKKAKNRSKRKASQRARKGARR